uniref:NFATC2-interacting protein n=1 Tax=Amphiprion ocellaris TaxID=80972 RepID=A0AAQ6A5W4_AMPOC
SHKKKLTTQLKSYKNANYTGSPLGSIFSQYLSTMSAGNQKKVRFHFDGCKVTNSQTPAQLDMEDGDIIEIVLPQPGGVFGLIVLLKNK